MFALRHGASGATRRSASRRLLKSRSYASDSAAGTTGGHSAHHSAAPVNESLGTSFYLFAGFLPASILLYYASRPGKNGEPSRLSTVIEGFSDLGKKWEERNTLHTAAIEQAAHDKHLFYNVERSKHVDLRFPEIFQTGSPINVPAGHYINLDKVVAHYRQEYIDDEERKAKKAAARRKS